MKIVALCLKEMHDNFMKVHAKKLEDIAKEVNGELVLVTSENKGYYATIKTPTWALKEPMMYLHHFVERELPKTAYIL